MKEPADPPPVLYHGTSPEVVELILKDGLQPMGRQYVHVSADLETAPQPVILSVDGRGAHDAGERFYQGNTTVWLADRVPGRFLTKLT